MKAQATYRHTFVVTREVEFDDEEFANWIEYRATRSYDGTGDAFADFLNDQEDEFHSEVFKDWRLNNPLPDDFEVYESAVYSVEIPVSEPTP